MKLKETKPDLVSISEFVGVFEIFLKILSAYQNENSSMELFNFRFVQNFHFCADTETDQKSLSFWIWFTYMQNKEKQRGSSQYRQMEANLMRMWSISLQTITKLVLQRFRLHRAAYLRKLPKHHKLIFIVTDLVQRQLSLWSGAKISLCADERFKTELEYITEEIREKLHTCKMMPT